MALPADELVGRVRHRLAKEAATAPTPARVAAALRAEGGLGTPDGLDVLRRVDDEVRGAGPLAPFLRDPATTDVLVTAPDEVWVDRGAGPVRVPVRFADDSAVRALVQRLIAPTGRRFDAAAPWVDAPLPDGTRLHAVLPPIAVRGTCVSLRTLRARPFTLPDLVRAGTVTTALAELLAAIVQARLTIVVTGGTGSGKTTLLASLLTAADPRDRIVTVEDAAELRLSAPHRAALEARPPNVEGAGEVRLADLVRQALRMRPDRLVVGEVRGPEVLDMLGAFNTGHEGGLTTLHANAAAEVPARLTALALAAGLPPAAAPAQIAAALDVIVHLTRGPDGRRRVTQVGVVELRDGAADVSTALTSGREGDVRGTGWPRLVTLLESRGAPPRAC